MPKMTSHVPFGHLQFKLWAKEGPGVKLSVWLPTTKVENPPLPDIAWRSVTRRWKTLEESYNFGQTSSRSEFGAKSYEHPKSRDSNLGQIGTPPWESREKDPFGCSLRGETQRILYGGRWWLPPSPGRDESCVSKCPWLVLTPKGVPEC
jgi:hypothetical protein